mmetsp:Transcript_15798/g.31163  ORF Transcript_15798/g.31163 Transcript_15798/m.31163 type:complete len:206 (-) Transcript_15798:257-874(-)
MSCKSSSSFSYSSMKAGLTVCSDMSLFLFRSSSCAFFLSFLSRSASSCFRSFMSWLLEFMLSRALWISSWMNLCTSSLPCMSREMARCRASRSESSLDSSSASDAPCCVMSVARSRTSLRSLSLIEKASPPMDSSSSSSGLLCIELYSTDAILISSLTAYPSAWYSRLGLSLMRPLDAMSWAHCLRNITRSCMLSSCLLTSALGS